MRWLLPALAILLVGCATSAAPPQSAAYDALPSLAGDYFRMKSPETGTDYHIHVRLPDGYADNPQKQYPIVYLLDGDSLFPMIAPTHLFLTYDDAMPEAIIVGIAYGGFNPTINRRDVDFSATSDNKDRPAGASQFLRFLKDGLLPQVERRYRADPAKRILLGQSRAAYFVLYSAFADPGLFHGRIASNPGVRLGEEAYLATAAPSDDKGILILSSGTKDRAHNRKTALDLGKKWDATQGQLPWRFVPMDISDGTHAADIARVYRAAMSVILKGDAPQ